MPSSLFLEEWIGKAVSVQVSTIATSDAYAHFVGTLSQVDRADNGIIQSVFVTECTAGTTQRTYQADNVFPWTAIQRISLPAEGLLAAHQTLIGKVRAGTYTYR